MALYSGLTSNGPTAADFADATGENFVIGTSSVDGRTIVAKSNDDTGGVDLFEKDGLTPVTDGSELVPGAPADTSASDALLTAIALNTGNSSARLLENNEKLDAIILANAAVTSFTTQSYRLDGAEADAAVADGAAGNSATIPAGFSSVGFVIRHGTAAGSEITINGRVYSLSVGDVVSSTLPNFSAEMGEEFATPVVISVGAGALVDVYEVRKV